MNNIQKAFTGVVILMIGLVIFYFQKRSSLLANPEFTTGRYLNYYKGVKTGGGLEFSYSVNGIEYKEICCQHLPTKCENGLMANQVALRQYTFPVVYDVTDPSNAELLVVKSQYERFKIEIPDSIAEIISIISICE